MELSYHDTSLSNEDRPTAVANVSPVLALKKARTPHRTFGYGPPDEALLHTRRLIRCSRALYVALPPGGRAVYMLSSLRSC